MKNIEINSPALKSILNSFTTALLNVSRDKFAYEKPKDPLFTADYATGSEYLHHMQNKKVDGFPEKTYGVDLMRYTTPFESLQKAVGTLDKDLLAWSGSRNNAVKMVYPVGGYMGWHNNANAPGYNLILSWSQNGLGYFRYQDPLTKDLVTMQDKPGWTCKVGYFGSFAEKEKVFWHSASAKHEERVTIAYIIPHEGLWEDMCEDVQSS